MKQDAIFCEVGEALLRLEEAPYEPESRLQRFVADFPDLLGDHQLRLCILRWSPTLVGEILAS